MKRTVSCKREQMISRRPTDCNASAMPTYSSSCTGNASLPLYARQ